MRFEEFLFINIYLYFFHINNSERPGKGWVINWHLFLCMRCPKRIIFTEQTWVTWWTIMWSFQIVLAAVHLLNSSVTFWGIICLILSRQKKEFWYIQKAIYAFLFNNLPSQYTHLWSLTLLMRRDRQIFGLKSLSLPLLLRTFFGLDLWFSLLCLSCRHSPCSLGLLAAWLLFIPL